MLTKAFPAVCTTCRAHVDSASELVKLYADKFDLLQSGATAPKKPSGSGASAATVKALEELKEVINGHLKVSDVCDAAILVVVGVGGCA